MMTTPADEAFLLNILKEPDESRFFFLLQNAWNLSSKLLMCLLEDKGRILPFHVTAGHLSWCPSITRDFVEYYREETWDVAGLNTMPWIVPSWLDKYAKKYRWDMVRQQVYSAADIEDLLQLSKIDDVPRRAISAHPCLTREIVAANHDFPWIRNIMPLHALEVLIGSCDEVVQDDVQNVHVHV